MSTYDSILVAVDGSEPARTAARQAIQLAKAFDASVTGLHVPEGSSNTAGTERDRSPDEEAEAAIESLKLSAGKAEVACQTTVRRGTPHEVIGSSADRLDADLVAMGTHGRTGVEGLLVGSVTNRTLRTSDVPVLATPEGPWGSVFDSVLVAVDGSDPAAAATDQAITFADRFDATLHVLSAVYVQKLADTSGGAGTVPSVLESITERHEGLVEDVADRAEARGIDTVTSVPTGRPAAHVRDHAEEHNVDLVTMGTHGHSGLKRYLLGSVAERTVRTAPAPVMTMPP
jgi:nucleotide-binding universal stress UspA family protein